MIYKVDRFSGLRHTWGGSYEESPATRVGEQRVQSVNSGRTVMSF